MNLIWWDFGCGKGVYDFVNVVNEDVDWYGWDICCEKRNLRKSGDCRMWNLK